MAADTPPPIHEPADLESAIHDTVDHV